MKQVKGKITLSRVTTNTANDYVSIKIADNNSRVRIINVEIDMKTFAMAITGLSDQNCNIKVYDNYEVIGKKKITKTVFCEKVYDKEKQRKIVNDDYEKKYKSKGWIIQNDGTNSQQNGDMHHYDICKYV